MKILIYLGHPAHFHLFKNVILKLQKKYEVFILIKKKEILEDLLLDSNIEYTNILKEGRKDSKIGILFGVLKRTIRLYRYVLRKKPDLLIGTSLENSFISKLTGIPSININEDDASVVPLYAKWSYPWATEILTPSCCNNGIWDYKAVKYNSYHELSYLHPNNFKPDIKVVQKYLPNNDPYFIVRFAKLTAHHDFGIKGLDNILGKEIIKKLEPYGKIIINSERNLNDEFSKYHYNISPMDMHHIIAFASIYIGDSQTMAAEAGVLGVPFIRINDFIGKIGYLNELETKYKLGYGINPMDKELIFSTIDSLLNTNNLNELYQKRRFEMLAEKIDLSRFLVWFIDNYPKSNKTYKSYLEDEFLNSSDFIQKSQK